MSDHSCMLALVGTEKKICLHTISEILATKTPPLFNHMIDGYSPINAIKQYNLYYITYENSNFTMLTAPKLITFKKGITTTKSRIFSVDHLKKVIEQNKINNPHFINSTNKKKNLFRNIEFFLKGDSDFIFELDTQESKFSQKGVYDQIWKFKFFPKLQPTELSPNFYYYFPYVKSKEPIEILETKKRESFVEDILRFYNASEKSFKFYCGPKGIGKTTTLLSIVSNKQNNITCCYFNIKTLFKYRNSAEIQQNLFLTETIGLFQYYHEYELMKNYFDDFESEENFWVRIIELITYFKKGQRKLLFIFDKYKTKYDHEGTKLREIMDKILFTKIKVIIMSDVNNDDIRDALLSKWCDEYQTEKYNLNFIYEYIETFEVDLTKDKESIQSMFFFDNSPYYIQKFLNNKIEFEAFKEKESEKILTQMTNFYAKKGINALQIFNSLTRIDDIVGEEISKSTFNEVIQVLPIKFFKINLRKESGTFRIIYLNPVVSEVIQKILSKSSLQIEIEKISLSSSERKNLMKRLVNYYFSSHKPFTNISIDIKIRISRNFDNFALNNEPLQNKVYLICTLLDNKQLTYDFSIVITKTTPKLILFSLREGQVAKEKIREEVLLIKKNIEVNFNLTLSKDNIYYFQIFDSEKVSKELVECYKKNEIGYLIFNMKAISFLSSPHFYDGELLLSLATIYEENEVENYDIMEKINCFKIQMEDRIEFLQKKRNREVGIIESSGLISYEESKFNLSSFDVNSINSFLGVNRNYLFMFSMRNVPLMSLKLDDNKYIVVLYHNDSKLIVTNDLKKIFDLARGVQIKDIKEAMYTIITDNGEIVYAFYECEEL